MSSNIVIEKNCIYCGKEFLAKTLHTRYCSHICNRKHYKNVERDNKIRKHLESNAVKQDDSEDSAHLQAKEFLSVNEAATLIGTSKRTIERQIANGKLKAMKFGARTIIPRNSINQLFNI